MQRDVQTYGITLKSVNWGELHRKITFLTPDLGVVEAVVYGARKGKLSATCEGFTTSRLFLYAQPGRDYYTLKDVEILRDLRFLRSDISRIYAAHAMSEIALKMHGGDYEQMYVLLTTGLELLDEKEHVTLQVLIQFIDRAIQIMGLAGELDACPVCSKRYGDADILEYNTSLHSAVCSECSDTSHLLLYPGMRRYFVLTRNMNIEQAAAVELSESARERIFIYLRDSLRDILGYPLQSLKDSTMFMIPSIGAGK